MAPEGGEHTQWSRRLAAVTFKEVEHLKLKALLLKILKEICDGGWLQSL